MYKTIRICAVIAVSMFGFAGSISALSTAHEVLVLDLNRDGLDFSNYTATAVMSDGTGDVEDLRWTQAGSDDAFIVLDATSLRAVGYEVSNSSGAPIDGNTMFRDGLRIRVPGETSDRIITDGWDMLGAFDHNNDGKISANDPVWDHLKLFNDSNADGTMGSDELRLTRDILKEFFETGDIPTEDQFGNRFQPGTYTYPDDSTGYMAGVQIQPVPEPGAAALVALGLVLLGARRRG